LPFKDFIPQGISAKSFPALALKLVGFLPWGVLRISQEAVSELTEPVQGENQRVSLYQRVRYKYPEMTMMEAMGISRSENLQVCQYTGKRIRISYCPNRLSAKVFHLDANGL
jgi:hypothetical protein